MPKSRKTSKIWDLFTETRKSMFAVCNMCNAELSFKSSTTNLRKHLDRKHPDITVDLSEKRKLDLKRDESEERQNLADEYELAVQEVIDKNAEDSNEHRENVWTHEQIVIHLNENTGELEEENVRKNNNQGTNAENATKNHKENKSAKIDSRRIVPSIRTDHGYTKRHNYMSLMETACDYYREGAKVENQAKKVKYRSLEKIADALSERNQIEKAKLKLEYYKIFGNFDDFNSFC